MMNKQDARVVFMGTPDIAARCLEQLISDGYNIAAVFTREDKPVGRKQIMTAPPVKQVALRHNIPVYQPKNFKGEAPRQVAQLCPDLIVVVAYGRILPQSVIDIPSRGCINLHVSLLPKYRGAAPVQWAVINGDAQTGVTVMQIDRGMDTGDIIDVLPIDIDEDENREQLFQKVTDAGKVFLSAVAEKVLAGDINPTPQDHSKAVPAPPLTKEMGEFALSDDYRTIHNKVRGMYPWPGAYFVCEGKRVKVLKTKKSEEKGKIGEILSIKPLTVRVSNGAVQLLTVQPENSKAMDGTAWARGRRFKKGDIIE